MKKTLKAHDERNVKQKDSSSAPEGALPTYLLDREGQNDANSTVHTLYVHVVSMDVMRGSSSSSGGGNSLSSSLAGFSCDADRAAAPPARLLAAWLDSSSPSLGN